MVTTAEMIAIADMIGQYCINGRDAEMVTILYRLSIAGQCRMLSIAQFSQVQKGSVLQKQSTIIDDGVLTTGRMMSHLQQI